MNLYEHVPETIKVSAAVAAPALTIVGYSVEQWTFVLSAIVSLLVIAEKLPGFVKRCKEFVRSVRRAIEKRKTDGG